MKDEGIVGAQTIVSPAGEEMVVISRAEAGARKARPTLRRSLARVSRVRMEDVLGN